MIFRKKLKSGFTLVELLVVIAVLGILATVSSIVYTKIQNDAKVAKVKADLTAMSKQIESARQIQDKFFYQLTEPPVHSQWGAGACWIPHGGDTTKVKDIPSCVADLRTYWSSMTSMPLPTDPWGAPYLFDENEMEPAYTCSGDPSPPLPDGKYYCRWDILFSAGPDGMMYTNDDYLYYVPPYRCSTKEQPDYIPGIVVHGVMNHLPEPPKCKWY